MSVADRAGHKRRADDASDNISAMPLRRYADAASILIAKTEPAMIGKMAGMVQRLGECVCNSDPYPATCEHSMSQSVNGDKIDGQPSVAECKSEDKWPEM